VERWRKGERRDTTTRRKESSRRQRGGGGGKSSLKRRGEKDDKLRKGIKKTLERLGSAGRAGPSWGGGAEKKLKRGWGAFRRGRELKEPASSRESRATFIKLRGGAKSTNDEKDREHGKIYTGGQGKRTLC